jgi:hypothetical protein
MSIEWVCMAGAAVALLLAAAYGITTRRGLSLVVIALVLSWAPMLIGGLKEYAREKTRIEKHESLRAERRTPGS